MHGKFWNMYPAWNDGTWLRPGVESNKLLGSILMFALRPSCRHDTSGRLCEQRSLVDLGNFATAGYACCLCLTPIILACWFPSHFLLWTGDTVIQIEICHDNPNKAALQMNPLAGTKTLDDFHHRLGQDSGQWESEIGVHGASFFFTIFLHLMGFLAN